MKQGDQKVGPYTQAELYTIWRSAVDGNYARGLEEAGDGNGLEVINQGLAQLARTSSAIDSTFQSMYTLPWSGQSNIPASLGAKAFVELTFVHSRTDIPIIIPAGAIVEEVAKDAGDNGAVDVPTGRRYITQVDTAFLACGPAANVQLIDCLAENEGVGYNNPMPGSIKRFVQNGLTYSNTDASIVTGALETLVLGTTPDVVLPNQVGQYLYITSGAVSAYRRIKAYFEPTPGNNGAVLLASMHAVFTNAPMNAGYAQIKFGGTVVGACYVYGTVFISATSQFAVTYELLSGLPASVTGTIVMTGTAVTATVLSIFYGDYNFPSATGVSWRAVDLTVDFGLTVTNAASPTGGKISWLEERGAEKKLPLSAGETQENYRMRQASVADMISPNAVLRAANRILQPFSLKVIMREVATFGLFFDEFAYDMTGTSMPADYWRSFYMDNTRMRAYFLIELPPPILDPYGMFYDSNTTINAYNVLNKTDAIYAQTGDQYRWYQTTIGGALVATSQVYKAIYAAVNSIKAAGVGFDLVQGA